MNGIIAMALHYLLAALAKWDLSFSWTTAKTAINAAVNAVLPAWLQPMVDAAVDMVVDCVSLALADTADLALIVADLQAQDWTKAVADLTALVMKVSHPAQPAVLKALQLCA